MLGNPNRMEQRCWPAPAAVLPHRPPFLLVDEIVTVEPNQWVEGLWIVGPDVPTLDVGNGNGLQVPPLLVVEALAQLGAYGAILWAPQAGLPLFAQLDQARFYRPVRPGSRVRLEVEVERLHRRGGRGTGRAFATDEGNGDEPAVDVRLGFVFATVAGA
jgi:3-hydroxyacyl-[acyl-carrier-protein] dehydratase